MIPKDTLDLQTRKKKIFRHNNDAEFSQQASDKKRSGIQNHQPETNSLNFVFAGTYMVARIFRWPDWWHMEGPLWECQLGLWAVFFSGCPPPS